MARLPELPRYDRSQPYSWNYQHAPDAVDLEQPPVAGEWRFCGLDVDSPLGVPAGPLLNGRWCLYYASLGFDVLTYKTVRSGQRDCYPLPNLQPVGTSASDGALHGGEERLPAHDTMLGSWAVSFGMPSASPDVWRSDIERTRQALPSGKLLSVSVVGTVQEGWTIDDLANDYARCAKWAVESGADCVETNFSCPNVSTCDGQLYQQPHDATLVATRVRQAIGNVPYICKVGRIIHQDEAEALIDALSGVVDALAMTNSIAATIVDSNGDFLFEGEKRGICGDATREASVSQVRMLSDLIRKRNQSMQLIGVGGASSANHVHEYLGAGAHAVHLATAAMVQPDIALEIRRHLDQMLANNGGAETITRGA